MIYKLNVPEEAFKNKDVKITVISISGNPKLYVNPEMVPEYSPTSIWKEESGVSKSIVIPYVERVAGIQHISVELPHIDPLHHGSFLCQKQFLPQNHGG